MKLGADQVVVVLVSPKGALNVGGIARLMGNFGLKELRIVDPRCDLQSVDCKQMAMHSFSLVKDAKIFSDLASAIADRTQVIALSGRSVEDRRPHASLPDFARSLQDKISQHDRVALVFGREEIGLKLEELCQCRWQIEIPTDPEHFSINLTSAAAITFYEFFQNQKALQNLQEIRRPEEGRKHLFFERLFPLLDEIKFLNKENPMHLRDDLWALMHRTDVDDREMRILFGVLTCIEQTIERLKKQ